MATRKKRKRDGKPIGGKRIKCELLRKEEKYKIRQITDQMVRHLRLVNSLNPIP
jgi:hypothetical protein